MLLQAVEFQRKLNVHSISKARKGIYCKSADLELQKTVLFPRPAKDKPFHLEVVKDSFFSPQPVNFPLRWVFM